MKSIRIILALMLLVCVNSAYAQRAKIKTIKGEYTYTVPSNVSMDEAVHTAIERAKIEALEKEYGTVMSQSISTVMHSSNGRSDSDMLLMAQSQVKGEWLETIGEPEVERSFEQDMLIIHVKITGRARELKSHKLDLQTKILRNTTELVGESNQFTDGDKFYLYLRSPLSGYLAVYMEEDATQQVYCLLPYLHSNNATEKIEANKDYIFFKKQGGMDTITDEYELCTEGSVDYETIYIVFSPNPFYRANAQVSDDRTVPMQLSHQNFMAWLMKNEAEDKDFLVVRKHIEVRKK